jgi:hypothetical protein
MLGKVLEDLTLAKRSKYFLIATLTLLNPVPLGVVVGPFNAILFLFIDSKVSLGKGVPNLL